MINRQVVLGEQVSITVSSLPDDDRIVLVILDGANSSTATTITNITGNIWKIRFSPTETGIYDVVLDDVVVASVEVITRSIFDYLKTLEDQALGTWEWDKSTKVLSVFKLDGTLLATYDSDDTPELAYSRYVSQ